MGFHAVNLLKPTETIAIAAACRATARQSSRPQQPLDESRGVAPPLLGQGNKTNRPSEQALTATKVHLNRASVASPHHRPPSSQGQQNEFPPSPAPI
jgi:hypothetical protein